MQLTPLQQEELVRARRVIASDRARDIVRLKTWEHGMCLERGSVRPDVPPLTAEEQEAVRSLWNSLPGWTCWMTAVELLARDERFS